MSDALSLPQFVDHCQKLMAHAWLVRTFIKHCEEVDDFPELSQIVRAVFDISRALDTRVADPEAYIKMLRKKLPRFRTAVAQFAHDAPLASMHTNFQQAVVSIQSVAEDLTHLLSTLPAQMPTATPSTMPPDQAQSAQATEPATSTDED
jgi:hypothetical protein